MSEDFGQEVNDQTMQQLSNQLGGKSILDQCSVKEAAPEFRMESDYEKIRFLNHELVRVQAEKNGAYKERNKSIAAMAVSMKAMGYEVYRSLHPENELWESDWRNILFIETPFGQLSWHFHDSETYLLSTFPMKPNKYDGHTTDDKYNRLLAFTITNGMSKPQPKTRTKKAKVKTNEPAS